jgi:hypothetical protein
VAELKGISRLDGSVVQVSVLPLLWKEPLQKHIIMAAAPPSQAISTRKLSTRLDKMMALKVQ